MASYWAVGSRSGIWRVSGISSSSFLGIASSCERSSVDDITISRDDNTVPLPRLLDIGQVAEHLGVEVRHIRRLVAERRIPYLKWGRLLRFDPAGLAEWLDHKRVAPRVPVTAAHYDLFTGQRDSVERAGRGSRRTGASS
ncbi:MAG: DNA-binding protein [Actinobacteria bacterium]|nr:MAG: DNA-binding protein [Actinomycetota bacterium]RIK07567.1 MAG: hypothetical protein DCC48_03455 [Acidobacteriota bacterium]